MKRRQTFNYKISMIQLWYRAPVKDACEWQLTKSGNGQKGKENSSLSSSPPVTCAPGQTEKAGARPWVGIFRQNTVIVSHTNLSRH